MAWAQINCRAIFSDKSAQLPVLASRSNLPTVRSNPLKLFETHPEVVKTAIGQLIPILYTERMLEVYLEAHKTLVGPPSSSSPPLSLTVQNAIARTMLDQILSEFTVPEGTRYQIHSAKRDRYGTEISFRPRTHQALEDLIRFEGSDALLFEVIRATLPEYRKFAIRSESIDSGASWLPMTYPAIPAGLLAAGLMIAPEIGAVAGGAGMMMPRLIHGKTTTLHKFNRMVARFKAKRSLRKLLRQPMIAPTMAAPLALAGPSALVQVGDRLMEMKRFDREAVQNLTPHLESYRASDVLDLGSELSDANAVLGARQLSLALANDGVDLLLTSRLSQAVTALAAGSSKQLRSMDFAMLIKLLEQRQSDLQGMLRQSEDLQGDLQVAIAKTHEFMKYVENVVETARPETIDQEALYRLRSRQVSLVEELEQLKLSASQIPTYLEYLTQEYRLADNSKKSILLMANALMAKQFDRRDEHFRESITALETFLNYLKENNES